MDRLSREGLLHLYEGGRSKAGEPVQKDSQIELLSLCGSDLTVVGVVRSLRGLDRLKYLEIDGLGPKESVGKLFSSLADSKFSELLRVSVAGQISAKDFTTILQKKMLHRFSGSRNRLESASGVISDTPSSVQEIRDLQLGGLGNSVQITDDELELLARERLPNLLRLNLQGTAISDNAIGSILKFQSLQDLILDSTKISETGLQRLTELKNLRRLSLVNVPGAIATARRLRELLPDCEIRVTGSGD